MNYDQFLESLPSASQNNSRQIVRGVAEKAFKERYGGFWGHRFTELTGIEPSDERTGADTGHDPAPIHD